MTSTVTTGVANKSSTIDATKSITHERDIPSIASRAMTAQAEPCFTELSFCLPTSLAFAKRLTWEQTPWITNMIDTKSANPINEADAHLISNYLASHFEQKISAEAIQNAMLFGSTYPSSASNETLGTYPHIFVVFPHARSNPSQDESFLKIWHDQIVKPAFDRAWKDSGLAAIYGAEVDGQTRILPPSGTRSSRDALPATGFLKRLRNLNPNSVRDFWPVWNDDWGMGSEGQYTAKRTIIYNEAWLAILGMLEGHPDLPSFQDPVLLAVSRGKVYVADDMGAQDKFKCVGQEWDKFVDSRFVRDGSFKVVFETVVGTQCEGAVQLERDIAPHIEGGMGREFKRVAPQEEMGDGDGHRDKRARRAAVEDEEV